MKKPTSEPSPPRLRLDQMSHEDFSDYLQRKKILPPGSTVTVVESPGAGNMNLTFRVGTETTSVIVKQAPPWVAKYPSIAAPANRAAHEAAFYQKINTSPYLAARMPALLAYDSDESILILEDLGSAAPCDGERDGGPLFQKEDLVALAAFLENLRAVAVVDPVHFANTAMRELNHEHIFDLPLRADNGLNERLDSLTPGLSHAGHTLRKNAPYLARIHQLGQRYLTSCSGSLLHGDFFPGSLLRQANGKLKVIDPEFCFVGDPEFDVGVFLAHLALTRQPDDFAVVWLASQAPGLDSALIRGYAGAEIMRRVLGVAQLPISTDLNFKRALLEKSVHLVLAGDA